MSSIARATTLTLEPLAALAPLTGAPPSAPAHQPARAPARAPRDRAATPHSKGAGLAVLIPAYNEAACIADTIRSVQAQSLAPDQIIVVDDCSSDATGDIARSLGVRVLRTPANAGCKARALNYALDHISSEFILAIDADTTLALDGIEQLMRALKDPTVGAACGFVIPRHVRTLWERGRYIEYLFAFSLYKPLQDFYDKPLLASGCFSVYRTELLKTLGGWPTRTVAEDMDLTWNMYLAGHRVRFVEEAVCYPIEPHSYTFLARQLRRWSCGFVQCCKVHWKDVVHVPFLRHVVAIGLWDATVASIAFLLLLPLLAVFVSPLFLAGYLIDIPAVLVPVIYKARQRGEVRRALASLPGFFVIRFVNAVFVLRALWCELVSRRSLKVFEKGH